MQDYSKLVKALRCCIPNPLETCEGCTYNTGGECNVTGMMDDAADAIVALGLDNEDYEHENRRLHGEIEALQAEQKKTVTQIFGEEQMAWEGRCKDLMKHISDLQAEVERLKDSNEELREKQTFIDHYGDKWMTSAKDVPTAAYEHGYADGKAEERAKMQKRNAELHAELERWVSAAEKAGEPKRGRWIYHPEWANDGECGYECSVCGMGSDVDHNFCMRCGADMRKMEVQDEGAGSL